MQVESLAVCVKYTDIYMQYLKIFRTYTLLMAKEKREKPTQDQYKTFLKRTNQSVMSRKAE